MFLIATFSLVILYSLIPLFAILCSSYINIFQHSKAVSSNISTHGKTIQHKVRDQSLSLNLTLIIMFHGLCWLMTFIMSHLFMMQVKMPDSTMALLVVGIMPINSLLNPILYTLKSAASGLLSAQTADHKMNNIK